MKKFLSVFVAAMLICLSFVCANAEEIDANAPEAPWYELSGEGTILTVRLPGNNKDGMDWNFEISNPEALELITQEEIEGESEGMAGAPTTYIGSFMSTASAENKVSLILRYRTDDPEEASFATRVLELNVSADNVISVVSVLERNQSADWIEYDMDNFILTVRLPAPENGSQNWDMSILDPDFFELITCETENGYVGSFMSNLSGAGFTELQISNGNTDYTVNLFASEAGDLFVEWAEVFTVLTSEAIAE
jgi:predicted secreted protein